MSENAIKYRVRRMLTRLRKGSREDLLALLAGYLTDGAIESAHALKARDRGGWSAVRDAEAQP
jgi:hypothetical protein